jgi:hypothetical protein
MRFFLLLVAAVGCDGDSDQILTDSDDELEDLECPNIEHIPVQSPQIIGEPVTVSANISDESGVLSAILYYKVETAITWDDTTMEGSGADFVATIPGKEVGAAAGMHYYIWAQDGAPALNACTVPNDGEEGPFHFTIDTAEKEKEKDKD